MDVIFGKKYSFEGRIISHFAYYSPLVPSTVLHYIHVFEIETEAGIIIPCVAAEGSRGTLGFLYQDPGNPADPPDWDELIYTVNIGDQVIMEGEFGRELSVYKPVPWKQEFFVFAPQKLINTTNFISKKLDNSIAESNSGIATAIHAARKGNLMISYQFISRELNLLSDSISYIQKNSDKKSRYIEFMEISRLKLWELCSKTASQIAEERGFSPDIPRTPSSGIELLIEIGLLKFLYGYVCQNILDTIKIHLQLESKRPDKLQSLRFEYSENHDLARLYTHNIQKTRLFLCPTLDLKVVESVIKSPTPSRNIGYQHLGDILVSFRIREAEIEKSLETLRANHIATTVFMPRISTLQTSKSILDVGKSPLHSYFMRMWGEHL